MPGPPKKPTALKVLEGNPGRQRLNKAEPKFTGDATCPAWLSPEAKAEWKRIAPAPKNLGLLTNADRATMAGYCSCWADFREAEEKLLLFGHTVKRGSEERGYEEISSPYVAIKVKALQTMLRYMQQLGFTPASRASLVTPDKQGGGFAEWQRKKHGA